MARDYKRTRKRSGGRPGWVLFVSGFGLGLIAAFGFYVAGGYRFGASGTATDCPKPPVARGEQVPQPKPRHEPRFDFYTLLPNVEVEVPPEAPPAKPKRPSAAKPDERPRSNAPAKPTAQPARGRYILQAGSFKRFGEADALKARLALMGLSASIQKVKVGDSTYHRVRVGPFPSFSQAEQAQRRLRQASVDSLLMKLGR